VVVFDLFDALLDDREFAGALENHLGPRAGG
jgi:hypothetical protein